VKMTYDARVTVPSWATAIMSALSKDVDTAVTVKDSDDGRGKVYKFNQPVPIPSYLFALAVGELDSRDVSPRCRVWSKPSVVNAIAFEFSQVEHFLKAAEELNCLINGRVTTCCACRRPSRTARWRTRASPS